jgi:hypothetical protein
MSRWVNPMRESLHGFEYNRVFYAFFIIADRDNE